MESVEAILAFFLLVAYCRGQNLLQNGDFEAGTDHWDCWGFQCTSTTDKHSGQHALRVTGRQRYFNGPSQYFPAEAGQTYTASGWFKVLDQPASTMAAQLFVNCHYQDGSDDYIGAATRDNVKVSDGWIHLTGSFTIPNKPLQTTRIYYQTYPDGHVSFVVDDMTVTKVSGEAVTFDSLNQVINRVRKNDIIVHVAAAANINKADVQIRILQTNKSFPFGSSVSTDNYNNNAANGKYRAFIHQHFNWAVLENSLKWYAVEQFRDQKNYQPPLDALHRLRSHGIKVRGHNLIWSSEQYVQDWVKQLYGDELRREVKEHIEETMNVTRGLLEHWDVNNENLHATWYQDRLNDPDYNLEVFRIAHNADSNVVLFLNDYGVVAGGGSTDAYLAQAVKFKAANVGLGGIGAECHFGDEQEPDMTAMKMRLDTLAQAGLPIWVTELDVGAVDENVRADYYEKALRAAYGHPAVEGILFWGFWDRAHWRGEKAALVRGNNLDLTAAGRRVLDLFENEWMTDETHTLSQSDDQFTVRGFHGDYEVRVMYHGRELLNLRQTFTLNKGTDKTVHINVHQ